MNDYRVGVLRRATHRDIQQRTELAIEAIEERNEDAMLAFAEHLIDQGLLAAGVEELTLATTVQQMVIAYASTKDGQREVGAWARQLAEDQCEGGIAA